MMIFEREIERGGRERERGNNDKSGIDDDSDDDVC